MSRRARLRSTAAANALQRLNPQAPQSQSVPSAARPTCSAISASMSAAVTALPLPAGCRAVERSTRSRGSITGTGERGGSACAAISRRR